MNVDEIAEKLSAVKAFECANAKTLKELAASVNIVNVLRGKNVLLQGERYKRLYVLISGECSVRICDDSGKELKVEQLTAPQLIAPAALFSSKNELPVNPQAAVDCKFFVIPKAVLLKVMTQDEAFLECFLRSLSDRLIFLSERLSFLSLKPIKKKAAEYLLSLPVYKGESELPAGLEELAMYLAVPRPSLSRTLLAFAEEGILRQEGRKLRILNAAKLEEYCS